jgi:hypothetical protein
MQCAKTRCSINFQAILGHFSSAAPASNPCESEAISPHE